MLAGVGVVIELVAAQGDFGQSPHGLGGGTDCRRRAGVKQRGRTGNTQAQRSHPLELGVNPFSGQKRLSSTGQGQGADARAQSLAQMTDFGSVAVGQVGCVQEGICRFDGRVGHGTDSAVPFITALKTMPLGCECRAGSRSSSGAEDVHRESLSRMGVGIVAGL